jgi:hypothetical protein
MILSEKLIARKAAIYKVGLSDPQLNRKFGYSRRKGSRQ